MKIQELKNAIDNGLSTNQIAKKYNKSQSTIQYWLKKFQLKTKYKAIGKGYIPPWSEKYKKFGSKYKTINWNECQKLYDQGLTWKELTLCGYPHNGIRWAAHNKKLIFRNSSEAQKLVWKTGKIQSSIYQTPEHRKKMSKFGGMKEKSGRCKKYLYKQIDGTEIWLQGSWELKLANFLDSKNIKWNKNKTGFNYVFNGKHRKYYPDFIVNNVYIEVKGYQTELDLVKWKQFKSKLLIIKKEQINNLDVWFDTTFKKILKM